MTICGQCKKVEAIEGRKSCQACLDTKKRQSGERAQQLKDAGMCRCGKNPLEPGKTCCEACRVRRIRYTQEWTQKQHAQGLCVCGKGPVMDGKTMCEACCVKTAKRSKAWSHKNKDAGLCMQCGKVPPQTGFLKCIDCRDQHRQDNQRLTYGLKAGAAKQMLADQNYQCKICGTHIKDKYHVDHDHDTGRVRGLLCNACNVFLGKYQKRMGVLVKYDDYIASQKQTAL